MYGDTVDNYLYVGGSMYNVGISYDHVIRWDGSSWDTLDTSLSSNSVKSIIRFQNSIYVSGTFSEIGGVTSAYVAKWNGSQWEELPSTPNGSVFTMLVYNDELYIGGIFDSVGTIRSPGVAKWNGSQWSSIGGGAPIADTSTAANSSRIYSIAMYQDQIHIAGTVIDSSTGKAIHLLRFNGNTWETLPNWGIGTTTVLTDMLVYKDELYIGGQFFEFDGSLGNNILKWNGSVWSNLGGGFNETGPVGSGTVEDMVEFNNELYVVGRFDEIVGLSSQYIARWNGSRWCQVGNSIFNGKILDIACWNQEIYISGGFEIIDSDTVLSIAKWIGSKDGDSCHQLTGSRPQNFLEMAQIAFISPNPVTKNTTIHYSLENMNTVGEIQIYDLSGRVIQQFQIYGRDQKKEIDCSNMIVGMYICTISVDQTIKQAIKLIVER